MKLRSICIFIFCLATLSCYKKGESNTTAQPKGPPSLLSLMQDLKVICHDQESCSPSVGNFMVFDVQKDETKKAYRVNFGNCTASLIAPDTVITNRHCFIKEQTKPGDDCSNIFVKFPKVREFDEEISQCQEIVFRPSLQPKNDQEKVQNLDVAIIRLTKVTNRPILKVNNEGFKNNEWVTIHRFTTQESGSYLEALHCPVIQDAALTPFMSLASHPYSAFVYLADCPIVESNSGSPILDSHSQIKAVVNMYIDSKVIKNTFPKATKKFKDAAGGINMACVNSPLVNPNPIMHPQCQETLDWTKQAAWSESRLQELKANRIDLIKEKYPDFYKKMSLDFSWEYSSFKVFDSFFDLLSDIKNYWLWPKCAKNQEDLMQFYQDLTVFPIFIEDNTFDEYGHLIENTHVQNYSIKNVEAFAYNKNFKLVLHGTFVGKEVNLSKEIPVCEK